MDHIVRTLSKAHALAGIRVGPAIAQAAYDYLLSKKVLVRHFPSHALTAPFLRISVGNDDEMYAVHQHLAAWRQLA